MAAMNHLFNSGRVAREMQRVIQANRLVEVAIVVVNRPGGNGTIALNQLLTHPGDGHVLMIGTPGLLSNHIIGLTPHHHAEFTTLVLLLEDYYGVNVRTASSIQSAREMLERMRKTPDGLVQASRLPVRRDEADLDRAWDDEVTAEASILSNPVNLVFSKR